jgi:hypothetical protein
VNKVIGIQMLAFTIDDTTSSLHPIRLQLTEIEDPDTVSQLNSTVDLQRFAINDNRMSYHRIVNLNKLDSRFLLSGESGQWKQNIYCGPVT